VQYLGCSSSSTINTGIGLTPITQRVAAGNANNTIIYTTAHRRPAVHNQPVAALADTVSGLAQLPNATTKLINPFALQPMKQPAAHNQPVADVGALAPYVVAEPVQLFDAVTKL
jgi:hypothetical protein